MRIFIFLVVLLMSLTLLILISNNANASDNITLKTKVIGDNITIHLITKVIPNNNVKTISLLTIVISSSPSYYGNYWYGCCGGDWITSRGIEQSTPLSWMRVFPNMIVNTVVPGSTCSDIRANILRVEPSSVTIGVPVEIIFSMESNCNYAGNVSLLLNGQNNQSLGVDLTGVLNRTYHATVLTSGLQPGQQNLSILGASSSFMVASAIIPTTMEPPHQIAIPVAPEEKTQDKIIFWVAVAIGAIILVTIILLVILR